MRLEVRAVLHDVLTAGRLIQDFTRNRSLKDYTADRMLRSAVERQFEIIGEALSRLRRLEPDLAERIPEYRRIIAFRNILIHGYDVVDDGIVWDVVVAKLPDLLARVTESVSDDSGSKPN